MHEMPQLASAASVPVTVIKVPGADHDFVFEKWGDEPGLHLRAFLRSLDRPLAPR